jgi:hypothetical protein
VDFARLRDECDPGKAGPTGFGAGVESVIDAWIERTAHTRISLSNLGEFLGHIFVFDGFAERREHLTSKLTRAVDRAGSRALSERVDDVVAEILAVGELIVTMDSRIVAISHTRLR